MPRIASGLQQLCRGMTLNARSPNKPWRNPGRGSGLRCAYPGYAVGLGGMSLIPVFARADFRLLPRAERLCSATKLL